MSLAICFALIVFAIAAITSFSYQSYLNLTGNGAITPKTTYLLIPGAKVWIRWGYGGSKPEPFIVASYPYFRQWSGVFVVDVLLRDGEHSHFSYVNALGQQVYPIFLEDLGVREVPYSDHRIFANEDAAMAYIS
jgi:hypothetical protein